MNIKIKAIKFLNSTDVLCRNIDRDCDVVIPASRLPNRLSAMWMETKYEWESESAYDDFIKMKLQHHRMLNLNPVEGTIEFDNGEMASRVQTVKELTLIGLCIVGTIWLFKKLF